MSTLKTISISDAHYQHLCDQFGAKLRAARLKIDMDQGEFAADIGMSQSTVSRWEKGHGLPRARMLYHLAKWMGISVDFLFGFSEHEMHQKRRRSKDVVGVA